jgi:hypothetical protein
VEASNAVRQDTVETGYYANGFYRMCFERAAWSVEAGKNQCDLRHTFGAYNIVWIAVGVKHQHHNVAQTPCCMFTTGDAFENTNVYVKGPPQL